MTFTDESRRADDMLLKIFRPLDIKLNRFCQAFGFFSTSFWVNDAMGPFDNVGTYDKNGSR